MSDNRRIEHLEHAVRDLARQHERLQHQLTTLLDALEDSGRVGQMPVAASPAPATAGKPATPSLLRRGVGRALRSTVGLARRLWRASEPDTGNPMIELAAEPASTLPELAAVVLGPPGGSEETDAAVERQTARLAQRLYWDRETGDLTILDADRERPRRVPARDARAVRDAARADFLLTATGALATLPATALEMARLALAAEMLDYLEIGDAGDAPALMVARRALWHPETGLDAAAADRRRPLLGKAVAGAQNRRPPDGAARVFRHWGGVYRLPRRRRGSWPHTLRPLDVPPPDDDGRPETGVVIVASAPLAGGFDQLAAGLLRAARTPPPLIALAPGETLQTERLRQLGRLSPRIYPLADYLPDQLLDSAVVHLAGHLGARRILHFGVEPLVAAPGGVEVVELPPAEEPLWHVAPPAAGERDGGGLRRELGIDDDAVVVTWAGDLVRHLRPEDFLAAAHRLRDDPRFAFLLVGRGPLEDTVADLERYFALANLHRPRAASLETVYAATDVVCATGERQPHPTFLLGALARGQPAVACPVDGLAALLSDGPCGVAVAFGDADAMAAALERLATAKERRALGERGPRAVRRFTREEAARRFARLLDTAEDNLAAAGAAE